MKNNTSLLAVILVVVICFLVDMDMKNWRKTERVIENDVHGYYGYLPAYFIFDDLKVEKSDYKYAENGYWFWMKHYENGTYDFGQTYGIALLYAPFFFTAHLCARWFDYPLTGFSEPYKYFLLLSSLFYLFAGLIFIRKSLRQFNFSDKISAGTLLLLGLGTNLFCYSSQSGPYPHVYNFFLISVFTYCTIKWHEAKNIRYSIGLALSFSLIVLISFANAAVLLFFLFYNVNSMADISEKRIPVLQLLLISCIAIMVWFPQLKYWKLATGSYFGAPDHYERYYFLQPVFWKGLFSFRKGWLVYTPLMTLALAGLLFLRQRIRSAFPGAVLYILVTLYITFCWWNWWYGGSFGQRAMIDSYAVLALPMASMLEMLFRKGIAIRATSIALFIFFVGLNIFQTYQYERGSLHYSAMTSRLYFKQFGKLDKIEKFDQYLDYPKEEEARNGNR